MVEELSLHIEPVLLGRGVRLFHGVDADRLVLTVMETLPSPAVTHVHYALAGK